MEDDNIKREVGAIIAFEALIYKQFEGLKESKSIEERIGFPTSYSLQKRS